MAPRAAWRLESLGFSDVYRLTGGKVDWMAHGYPIEGRDAAVPRIGDLANRNVPTCGVSDRVGDVKSRLPKGSEICVVLNDHRVVLGALGKEALEAEPHTPAGQVMEPAPATARPHFPWPRCWSASRSGNGTTCWSRPPTGS